jgi:hypothetical protein
LFSNEKLALLEPVDNPGGWDEQGSRWENAELSASILSLIFSQILLLIQL